MYIIIIVIIIICMYIYIWCICIYIYMYIIVTHVINNMKHIHLHICIVSGHWCHYMCSCSSFVCMWMRIPLYVQFVWRSPALEMNLPSLLSQGFLIDSGIRQTADFPCTKASAFTLATAASEHRWFKINLSRLSEGFQMEPTVLQPKDTKGIGA